MITVSWSFIFDHEHLSVSSPTQRTQDGTLRSTPFHVRFGKLQLLRSAEKTVRHDTYHATTYNVPRGSEEKM